MTVDEVIDEYCGAFGEAKEPIQRYVRYWEDYTAKCGHSLPPSEAKTLFQKTCEEYGLGANGSRAGWLALPYLYTNDILAPAFRILDEAERVVQDEDPMVQARIQFLRDGLIHLERTRDVVALVYGVTSPEGMTKEGIAQRVRELQDLRAELTPRHVLWGEVANWMEIRRKVRSAPGSIEWRQPDEE